MHFDFNPGSPTIWVFFSVLLFFIALGYFGVHKKIATALDTRADKIRVELEEARRLREEAQTLLASFQRKQKEAEVQAENIVKQARIDAENMAAQARKDLAERLERRLHQAEAKIANAESQAMADVKSSAADMAINAAEVILRKNMKPADQSVLVKDGITQMGKVMN